MNRLIIFVLRCLLGIGFAVLLIRIFYPGAGVIWIVIAAFGLVSLAYITENFRNRRKNLQGNGSH